MKDLSLFKIDLVMDPEQWWRTGWCPFREDVSYFEKTMNTGKPYGNAELEMSELEMSEIETSAWSTSERHIFLYVVSCCFYYDLSGSWVSSPHPPSLIPDKDKMRKK